jgi:hypothetical protein
VASSPKGEKRPYNLSIALSYVLENVMQPRNGHADLMTPSRERAYGAGNQVQGDAHERPHRLS